MPNPYEPLVDVDDELLVDATSAAGPTFRWRSIPMGLSWVLCVLSCIGSLVCGYGLVDSIRSVDPYPEIILACLVLALILASASFLQGCAASRWQRGKYVVALVLNVLGLILAIGGVDVVFRKMA